MTFPAVTLCNFNQFKRSTMKSDMLELMSQVFGPDASTSDRSESIDFSPANFENVSNEALEIGMMYISHKLEDMLVECKWKSSQNCSVRNFTRRFTDQGVCFTFNDPAEVSQRLKVRNAGSKEGLFMRLNVEHDEYTFGESTAAGFRVGVTLITKFRNFHE